MGEERASKLNSSITSLLIAPRRPASRRPAVSLVFLIFLIKALYYTARRITAAGAFIASPAGIPILKYDFYEESNA